MQFHQLAASLEEIEGLSSRLAITQKLAQIWSQLEHKEVWLAANLIQGQLQPNYDSLEFGLSEKMLQKSAAILINHAGGLAHFSKQNDLFGNVEQEAALTYVKELSRQKGDYGEVIKSINQQLSLTPQNLSISEVYRQLQQIAQENGLGSQERKLLQLSELLRQVTANEAKFIARMILGKMRLGFSLMTMIDSLSWVGVQDKSESKALEEIYQKKADFGLLAVSYLQLLTLPSQKRLSQLNKDYQLAVGVPVVPALCQRLNSSKEIIQKIPDVIAEPKYDGMRVQIHLKKIAHHWQVNAFTRSLENVSSMFPELKQIPPYLNQVTEVIFDSEAVAYSKDNKNLLSFQEMIKRKRKHHIAENSVNIPLRFYIFDVLCLNGEQLLDTPLEKRKKILQKLFTNNQLITQPPILRTQNAAALRDFHQQQLSQGLEGVVAKGAASYYQSGRKGWHWVKIKEAEGTMGKLRDTLDLMLMGIYAGKGKRHSFGVGAFLVGTQNQNGDWLTVSKIGTGLSDDDFRELKARTQPLIQKSKPATYQVHPHLQPDWWLTPKLVAEIAADEITKSNLHTSGWGLRFPRLVRWRDDKDISQVTTPKEIVSLTKID